jgi:hypothetical protein
LFSYFFNIFNERIEVRIGLTLKNFTANTVIDMIGRQTVIHAERNRPVENINILRDTIWAEVVIQMIGSNDIPFGTTIFTTTTKNSKTHIIPYPNP